MEPTASQKQPDIEELTGRLAPVLRRYGVTRAGIFGSVARGEAGPDSDLDLLVEYLPGKLPSLHELVDLNEDVAGISGRRVEIIQYKLLKRRIREKVLREQVLIPCGPDNLHPNPAAACGADGDQSKSHEPH